METDAITNLDFGNTLTVNPDPTNLKELYDSLRACEVEFAEWETTDKVIQSRIVKLSNDAVTAAKMFSELPTDQKLGPATLETVQKLVDAMMTATETRYRLTSSMTAKNTDLLRMTKKLREGKLYIGMTYEDIKMLLEVPRILDRIMAHTKKVATASDVVSEHLNENREKVREYLGDGVAQIKGLLL